MANGDGQPRDTAPRLPVPAEPEPWSAADAITERSVSSAISRTTCADRPAWLLRTARTATLLSLAPSGALLLDHWGADGGSAGGDDYLPHTPRNRPSQRHFLDGAPLAYTVYGDPAFKEPCLCVVYHDGTRIVRLAFQQDRLIVTTSDRFILPAEDGDGHPTATLTGHSAVAPAADNRPTTAETAMEDGCPTLELVFADPIYHLAVTHRFVVYPEHDLIVRSVHLHNTGDHPVTVERVLSAGLGLPPGEYESWTLHGQWGREFGLERRVVGPGKFVAESRRGFTSQEANPWFALTPAGETDEDRGRVWFGALVWSGNWMLTIEGERNDALHLVAGINPFDFAWHLAPGESFDTPALVCGYSEGGLGGAARMLHRFQADAVLPAHHRDTLRPVHYNSWEATGFAVTVEHQIALARRAAALGIELFEVDDGWFGARDRDQSGLGDWVVNPRKFPHGLDELIDEVHTLGMQFGIWVEPEMVNPDSDLYRAHPDWTLYFPTREPTFVRDQMVLNFARDDARAHILAQLQALLRAHRIDFLKWDHNRPYTEAGWPAAPHERQREVWVRHVRGVYEVLGALRAEFPHLLIETCAGGGGRVDLGILGFADQAWVSDNTEAADRLHRQFGYSHAYAPRTMVNWVTDVPNLQSGREAPLAFRFHVAMQGVLGIGGDILRWTDAECEQARALIAEYKQVRPLVQQGDQYWLSPPALTEPCVVQYVADDRRGTVVLLYQVQGVVGQGERRVRLRGLDPSRRYRRAADGAESTGAALMGAGLPIVFPSPPVPWHTQDWRSQLQLWQAAEG